ncbi:DJ-1/PfpI family protein [Phlyctema vagabunda]|uniref:DJ-1/PfpI family protein n=1 Tax=Phlyctema vagabunda TaxID=108571 RepID=A0ABR4PN11_9HELO
MYLHTLYKATSLWLACSTMTLVQALSSSSSSSTITNTTSLPTRFGVVLFPAFQALDVFGPLDALNLLSWKHALNVSLIAATLDAVSTQVRSPAMNPFNSSFGEAVVPTHTFGAPPRDLDVLLVPGGVGTRAPDRAVVIEYIRTAFPSLRYLVTVCTGAHLAAEAGVLDGRAATTNKAGWAQTAAYPAVRWVARARWVDDGKVWTSSGVSAGIDATLAWIAAVFGEPTAADLALSMEYERHTEAAWDPFAEYWNLTSREPAESKSCS